MLEVSLQVVNALQDAGAGLLLGADMTLESPGFAVHRELELLVLAGLTPYQALATGTRNVAVYLGTQDSTGTVAVGKRADLVLVDGNPLTDIRYTAGPAGAMVGGRWLARAELDARFDAVATGSRTEFRHMQQDALGHHGIHLSRSDTTASVGAAGTAGGICQHLQLGAPHE
jgi:adenine deaminase